MLTFTRAATAELAKKLSENPAANVERPSTVHSFAISVLGRNPGAADFPEPIRIADDWEYKHIVRPSLAQRAGVHKRVLDRLVTEMSANWESLGAAIPDPTIDETTRRRFRGAWREHRQIFGYTLLAELPNRLLHALENHPHLEGLNLDLLVVDEYQDLNACDLAVIRNLATRGVTVIGAGDDDQSIYSWRMADPEGIRRFPTDYAGSADYPLSVSQRCGRRLIDWARAVIEADPDRPTRAPLSPAAGATDGECALLSFSSERAEATGVARLVACLTQREGIPPSDVLILLRSDYLRQFSNPIRGQLARLGIEVSDPNMVDELLADPPHRFAISAFRLLARRDDPLAWGTMLELTDGVGDRLHAYLYDRARGAGIHFGQSVLDSFDEGFANAPQPSGSRAAALVRELLAWLDAHAGEEPGPDMGWGRWMSDVAGDGFLPALSAELQSLLIALDPIAEAPNLSRFLAQLSPLARDYALANGAGVRIMTMGGSKGLTVRATIVAAVEEGVIPRPGSDLAEERRLLYVAMTRSREFTYCTWARQRTGPTARAGRPRVGGRRTFSTLLDVGVVASEDGPTYLVRRWPEE